MQTDLTTFPDKQIKKVTTALDKMGAKVSLDLALVKIKKDLNLSIFIIYSNNVFIIMNNFLRNKKNFGQ